MPLNKNLFEVYVLLNVYKSLGEDTVSFKRSKQFMAVVQAGTIISHVNMQYDVESQPFQVAFEEIKAIEREFEL